MSIPIEPQAAVSTDTKYPHQEMLDKATAYYYAKDYDNAHALSDQLLNLAPHDYAALLLAGAIAREQKRFPESAGFLKRSIASSPDPQRIAAGWCGLGKTLREAGDSRQAEEAFRRAIRADPNVSGYATELAQTYAKEWKLDSAIKTLKIAIKRFSMDPLPCATLASLLMTNGRQHDALIAYNLALARNPNDAIVRRDKGTTLKMLGRFSEAENEFTEALRLDPMVDVYSQLAQLKDFKINSPELKPLIEQWDPENKASIETRIDAGFALARVYDRERDYRTAFRYLEEANRLNRSKINFAIADQETIASRVMALFTPDFLAHYSDKNNSNLAPIFILGMPRSGTTLTEQMLASHSQVQGGGELAGISRVARELGETWESRGEQAPGSDETVAQDLMNAAKHYADMTQHLWNKRPRFTDKLPMNFLYIGIIHMLFPKAKIIYCHRNPIATCFSCYQILFGEGNILYSYDLTELGQFYRIHEQLMGHWRRVLPDLMLEVEYEDLIEHPETNIKRLLEFCGLEYEPACLDFHTLDRPIATASLMQVRKPIYKESIDHWKNYQTFLGSLFNALRLDPTSIKSS